MATLLLDPNCEVAETVRNADLIDNTYQVGDALLQASWRLHNGTCSAASRSEPFLLPRTSVLRKGHSPSARQQDYPCAPTTSSGPKPRCQTQYDWKLIYLHVPPQVGHLSREVWPRLPGTLSHAPMVLLVNRSTASASEVLAGALHDNGRCAKADPTHIEQNGRGMATTMAMREGAEGKQVALQVRNCISRFHTSSVFGASLQRPTKRLLWSTCGACAHGLACIWCE